MNSEEYERLRSEYLGEEAPHEARVKLPSYIRIAGIVLLVVAAMFVLQQWMFTSVSVLSGIVPAMLRAASFAGTAILVLIVLSLLVRNQSIRRYRPVGDTEPAGYTTQTTQDPPENQKPSGPESAESGHIRWFRSVTDKKLFGVCGGLAAYYQIDPTLVRVLFVIAFFNYGFSLAIYVILAAVLPKKPVLPLT